MMPIMVGDVSGASAAAGCFAGALEFGSSAAADAFAFARAAEDAGDCVVAEWVGAPGFSEAFAAALGSD